MSGRIGNFLLTYSGIEFYPFDPRIEEIRIADIAHSLSNLCRYGGHSNSFYSVAEHSVRVSELVSPENRLWALLHDASEAYLGDLIHPLKMYSKMGILYQEIERGLMTVICSRFGLSLQQPDEVLRADKAMLWIESQRLMPDRDFWFRYSEFATGKERKIEFPLPPERAEVQFLQVFSNQ